MTSIKNFTAEITDFLPGVEPRVDIVLNDGDGVGEFVEAIRAELCGITVDDDGEWIWSIQDMKDGLWQAGWLVGDWTEVGHGHSAPAERCDS